MTEKKDKKDVNGTEDFKARLKKSGLKMTPQRLAVHEAMLCLGHASADMVCEHILLKKNTKVTVASVYNILSQLSGMGIYHRRLSSNNKMYFDAVPETHLHLYDTVNHTYTDIFDEEVLDLVEKKLAGKKIKGMKIDGVDIQILCHPTTRKRKKNTT